MKKSKRIISKALVLILVIGMIFATGCSKKDKTTTANQLAVTVGDQKIYMDEMMYYIYAMEANGEQYEQLYQQYYGTSYWDTEVEEGITIRDQMKDYVMDTAVMYAILYDKAVAEGYTLTEEEETTAKTNAESVLSQISEEQLAITGFTTESLTAVQEKLAIGERYYTDLVEGFDIDDQALTDSISKEDNRQYDTEYLVVPTVTYDESYQQVALTEEEIAAAKDVITSALEQAKAGDAFADIATALSTDDITVSTSTLNFVKDDGSAEESYQEAALALENDEIADGIIETETALYVIKMVDNNSTETYDAAVEEAIATAENDAFTVKYDEIKAEYTITENADVWDAIVMGETTLVETTTTPEATPETTTEAEDSTEDEGTTEDKGTETAE
ncbi:MAG: peptidylprolyl isomerase [Anaerocolumna sp.]